MNKYTREGFLAFYAGKALEHNPHAYRGEAGHAWDRGWMAARMDERMRYWEDNDRRKQPEEVLF